ncbi:hypothetical protein GCM10025777_22480 [Membranihabitans marinus]
MILLQLIGYKGVSQNEIRIACVGNSITYGAKVENREVNSYPAQLASMLGEGYTVGNFGRSGATLLKKGDYPYWETSQYQQALDFNPDYVFIKLGTNDTKPQNRKYIDEDYVKDYKALIHSFKSLSSNPRIVLLLPVPVFSSDTTGITAKVLTEKLILMIRQLAYETGSEVINLYNLMIDQPELFPDKVHPSAAGAKVMARRIYDVVKMQPVSYDLSAAIPKDAQTFNFHGYRGFEYTFSGRTVKVVLPKVTAKGHPWVWRARFWGHEPQADIALLERGYHIAFCDVAELFGNDEAMTIWDGFYQFLTGAGLAKKSIMEGMSRGGVYIYRWAARYPDRVAGIYADAPVLDLKSWPGGRGSSKGSPATWETFKKDFGFDSDEEAERFNGNPVDLTEVLSKSDIPMLHVVGDADDVVPVDENTGPFAEKINAGGGLINVIHKPGIGHHPHSLENPQPIVDFALRCTDYLTTNDLIAKPSQPQLDWFDYENLMFIHYAPNTWTGLSQDDNSLPLDRINPKKMDTDQWCKVAKSWGAEMIVFVAKHSGGFCWWQTNTTEYSARNIPWENGEGDLLADISASCKKYGLELGVYIYPGDRQWGAGLGSGGKTEDPNKQEAYNEVFRKQLKEVLSQYHPMKEVWFDGSCVIEIGDILEEYASDAVIFQGPQATIRWVGNERGIAPYPNWYTVSNADIKTGRANALNSDPRGEYFAPVEMDVPFLMSGKGHRWFWSSNTDSLILTIPELMNIYDKSVGRGGVLLLNATPDTTGLIPKSHVKQYKAFGKALKKRFSKPLASGSGSNVITLDLGREKMVNQVVIQEDISEGQLVMKYELEGFANGQWHKIKDGQSIGHKRIDEFPAQSLSMIRLKITDALANPVITHFSVYNNAKMSTGKKGEEGSKIYSVGNWSTSDYTEEWQEYSFDLTPYLEEKVGQFELKFMKIDHDRAFEKSNTGGYGIEFMDWTLEVHGTDNPQSVEKVGNGLFHIDHSQHITADMKAKILFKTKIKRRPGRAVGVIDLRMVGVN